MATDSQIAANRENSLLSTGPRTQEGRETSTRNALTHGLFTMRDFVRPEEKDEYARICTELRADLAPVGAIEETFVMTIGGAAWRLRRCSQVEADMVEFFSHDPMEDVNGENLQKSVDRARSQAFNILRHATAELRRLQTERTAGEDAFGSSQPGVAGHREVIRIQAKLASNCKPSAQTPRNAPAQPGTPGQNAPPVLGPLGKVA